MAGEYSCCASRDVTRTLVNIGDAIIGLAKLERVFEELYNSGKSPNDIDGEEIINLASFYNYIPPDAVDAYAEALVREYARFYRERTSG